MLVNIVVEYTMIVDMDTLTMEYCKYMVRIISIKIVNYRVFHPKLCPSMQCLSV